MSFEDVKHETFEGHPHTHLYTMSDPAGAVVLRTDLMKQVVCSPHGGELVSAVLSGEASPDTLPSDVRDLIAGLSSGLPESPSSTARTGMQDVRTLYVLPTLGCQLGCGYCRIVRKQGNQAGFRLSPQEARDAIDHVLGRAPSGAKRTLVFFGGEPLLVPETVFAAISHVREGPESDNTDIMLQTNGIAIDDETAEFLAANDVFVLLSLDGIEEVHNRLRKLATGGGSYEGSVAGYRKAKKHGCRMGVNATVTKLTEDRFVESFEALLDDLRPDKCGAITHLHPMSTGRSRWQVSSEMATRIQIGTFLAARRMGIYHQQMCEKLAPFVNGTWRRYACAGCGGKVVVAPNGTAGICEYNASDGRSFVSLEEFSEEAVSDFMSWAARSPLDTRECMSCSALPTCGGGCAYDSQILMGDPLKFDTWLCDTNIQIMQWLMHELLSHLHGAVAGQDFHEVTEQERALVLGDITVERTLAPMTSITEFAELREAGECAAG
jgi:uncharacterized protein